MLKNVYIKNLALIQEADINYTSGLNIMTGETGSGKSIIISAVNMALGGKANKAMIRNGADFGLVEISFANSDPRVNDLLKQKDISIDEDNIITISRKVSQDSSTSKINGESVNLATLKEVSSLLIDVHGQHDHQSLLNPLKHLDIVDDFAGKEVSDIKNEVRKYYDSYRAIKKEYLELNLDDESLNREIELIKFEINEIEEAAILPKEDELLEAEYKKLSNSETIMSAVNKAYVNFSDEEKGAIKKIFDSLRFIDDAVVYEPELKEFKSILMDIDSMSKDLSHSLSHYIENNKFDGERYKVVSDRLNLINKLKSKYGSSLEDIAKYHDTLSNKLKQYENYYDIKAEKEKDLKECASKLNKLSHELSETRQKAAKKLEPLITKNLMDLNFLNVEFVIEFSKNEKISINGFDKAEFLIKLNPGEPLLPLARTASGGEMSRVMLAIKSSIAENDEIPTLIFDEIDTGISGLTAGKVGEKLAFLSQNHQIICITHLPQIAAMADAHFQIKKGVEGGSTISGIELLSQDERVNELAKLVGGSTVSQAALENAKELIENARNIKQLV